MVGNPHVMLIMCNCPRRSKFTFSFCRWFFSNNMTFIGGVVNFLINLGVIKCVESRRLSVESYHVHTINMLTNVRDIEHNTT